MECRIRECLEQVDMIYLLEWNVRMQDRNGILATQRQNTAQGPTGAEGRGGK